MLLVLLDAANKIITTSRYLYLISHSIMNERIHEKA